LVWPASSVYRVTAAAPDVAEDRLVVVVDDLALAVRHDHEDVTLDGAAVTVEALEGPRLIQDTLAPRGS
jgi:hypothetical protein